MKKLLYFIGILFPVFCFAQSHSADIIPASDVHEHTVYYTDNTAEQSDILVFNEKCFGGILIERNVALQSELKKYSEKFWVWFAFGITSLAIIGLMLVFNKLKKNFNHTY